MEPGAPRRGREIRQAHARRQIHRPEEPRQADRQTVRGVREPAGHGPQGPALPFMTAQGTPPDDAQTTGRPGRDRTGPPGVPGVPQPHPRDRRTRPKDPPSWARHPPDNRIGLFKRQARGVRQQDQGHHPHGLRLPPREQPHRTRHAPLRRQSWRKRQSRHAVIDIPPFNGIVITCALLKRMDRARSSAG